MYTMESRIRYSEIDSSGRLSLGALLNYFQDSSTFHSEAAGVGLAYLQEKRVAWVLSAWQIEVSRYPLMGEPVTVRTAPHAFKGFFGYRNFLMETKDGEQLSCADTIWTLMDLSVMRPARPLEEMKAAYPLSERLPMERAERKIKLPLEGGQVFEALEVKKSRIDTNQHVNNTQYIYMALDYLPEGFQVQKLRAEYKKQARLFDKLIPVMYTENGRSTVVLKTTDGEICCVAEFS